MRIDVVTIFPAYLAPLELSLLGRAQRARILDVHVHDLRAFAHDRHRTVDDSPYGGGPGMVMRPEPWGEALDHVRTQVPGALPRLVVPTPSGTPFSQALARDLAAEAWLAFACGRYEGIDQRAIDEAATRMPVSLVSLGDYVLGGGEVAVLAIIEAVARLLPGVLGNAESLVEESHEDGLLEYPVYTKPAVWRGRAVPEVLRSGDHGAVAAWRHEQRLARTAARRPDLLHPSSALGVAGLVVDAARPSDAPELMTLQRACWAQEGVANSTLEIPVLVEPLAVVSAGLAEWQTWVVRSGGRLVGSVRGRVTPDEPAWWEVGRLMVAPDLQGRGIGRALLEFAEAAAASSAVGYRLVTGARSVENHRFYRKAGYRPAAPSPIPGTVLLRKRRRSEPGTAPPADPRSS